VPKVLYINHTSAIGGAETNLLNILRFAKQGDFQPVGVLLPDNGPLADAVRRLGIPVGFITYHAFRWRNPFRYVQTISQLAKWIQRTHADVIHLNHQWLIEHVVLAGSLSRRPVVCHTRNYPDADFIHHHKRWFNRADALLFVSQAVVSGYRELELPFRRAEIIHDGIDLRRFSNSKSKTELRRMIDLPLSGPIIGFCGRIVPEKGPEDLIEAAPTIIRQESDAQIVFCGADDSGGAYVARLKRKANDLGVEDRSLFIGFRHDVENVLAAFDVLVLPSRQSMPEGLPLSILEGLAAGCLVVATPNSGVPEVIQSGKTGFLVEAENPEALAAGILHALTLPESEKERIRRAGRERVISEFSIERQVDQLGRLYRELLV